MVQSHFPAPPSREYRDARKFIDSVFDMKTAEQVIALADQLKARVVAITDDLFVNVSGDSAG